MILSAMGSSRLCWLDRVFLAPDGDGGGGAGELTPAGETYTKEQLERIVQGRITKIHQDLEKEKTERAKSDQRVKDLEDKVKEIPPPPIEPPSGDVEGRLKLLEKKHTQETESLKKSLEEETKKRTQAEQRRKELERDSDLTESLQIAGCRADAIEIAKNAFLPKVSRDEDDEKWVYNLSDGGVVSIRDGIAAELPDYLKDSTVKAGGSGSKGGARKAAKEAEIDSAKKLLVELEKKGKNSGDSQDVQNYLRQKRVVSDLERR